MVGRSAAWGLSPMLFHNAHWAGEDEIVKRIDRVLVRQSEISSLAVTAMSICAFFGLQSACGESRSLNVLPDQAVQQMAAAIKKNDLREAERIGKKLEASRTKDARIYVLYGIALKDEGRIPEAEQRLQRAVQLAPQSVAAVEALAELEYNLKSAGAELWLRKLLVMQPANETAHAMLAVTLYRKGQFDAAIAEFVAAGQAVASQPAALMAYGVSLAQNAQWQDAAKCFRNVLRMQSENHQARYDLALAEWKNRDTNEALDTLKPDLLAESPAISTLRLAAAIHEDREDTPEAVGLLRRAILADPSDAGSYIEFAILASKHNSFDVGIDMLNRALGVSKDKAALYMARGVLYGQSGEYDKAMADFEQVHALNPGFSLTATAEGIARSQRHDHEAALADFRRQVREHPEDALGHYLLAEALSWTPAGDAVLPAESLKEAIREVHLALNLDRKMVQAYDLLATLSLQNEDHDQAIQACQNALVLQPDDQQALYSLILVLRKNGDKEKLKPLVQRLMEVRKAAQAHEQQARYGRLMIADESIAK